VVTPLSGTEAGREQHSIGAGGDTTVEVDRVAEAIVIEELDRLAGNGERFSILSEEAGALDRGAPFPLVLVDPVDGSLNAKQGIPMFAVMLAVIDGPKLENTLAGYVRHLVTGETWTAIRGQGALHNGKRFKVLPADRHHGRRTFEVIGLESSPRAVMTARGLVEAATKIRILGSMALSIAHTATGGFDAFCAPFPVRVFDTAASVLLLREAGGVATDMSGKPLGSLAIGLDSRSTVLCAPNPAAHAAALKALKDGK
jgi:myo-inositol-1(or 4)-monophosphatase